MPEASARRRPAASGDPVIRRLADEGVFIGLTAWTQPSLVGPLYPAGVTNADERLQYYASRYPITEVDSTFYSPLAERTAALWVQRTPPGFFFDVKAFRLLTHHPTPPSRLWRDLRNALPAEQLAKPSVYARHLPPELLGEVMRRFAAAVEPMRVADRLGLVLFRFPRYVYPSRSTFGYLE